MLQVSDDYQGWWFGDKEFTKTVVDKGRFIRESIGQVQWLKPVIPALWETEVGESQGQEIETILVNVVKPCLY